MQMESIDVGGVTFFGVPAPSRDYNDGKHEPIDGILGFGLFADLLLTLDYPRKVVRIERGALPAADGAEILDYSGERGVPAIDITVGGVAARARLDSGNMIGMIVPAAMAEKLELESKPVSAGRAKTVTSDVEITRATLAGSVRIGRHELQRPELTFVGLSDVANVGSPVMASFAVTFDQKNHRVRFRRG